MRKPAFFAQSSSARTPGLTGMPSVSAMAWMAVKLFGREVCAVMCAQDFSGIHAGRAYGRKKDLVEVACIQTVFRRQQVPAAADKRFCIENDTVHIENQCRVLQVCGIHRSNLRIMRYSSGFMLSIVSGRPSMMLE